MKLIACLSILSLIFVFWSSVPTGASPRDAVDTSRWDRQCPIVLEQFQPPRSLHPDWWPGEIWAEWLTPPRRRKSRRKLRLWLYEFRQWYHKRVRRGIRWTLRALGRCGRRVWRWLRRLQQAWQKPIDETPPLKSSAENPQPSASMRETSLERPRSSRDVDPAPAAGLEVEDSEQPEKRGLGRPREIPTDHRCCPNEACSSYGILGPHPDHDIVGAGTYPVQGGVRQMYKCNICGKRFSETAGTPFHHLKTPQETVLHAYKDLAEGLGVRATARVNGVDKDTVLRWVKRAGQHCQQVSEYMLQGLELTQAQMDELWTFVRKKQRQLSEWEKEHTEYGDNWIWIVFDPVHKLVPAVLVGKRTEEEAKGLLEQLKERLAEGVLPSDAVYPRSPATRWFTTPRLSCTSLGSGSSPRAKGTEGAFPSPARWLRKGSNTLPCTRSARRATSSPSPLR